ncbi:hypothetical protein [Chelativorans salis]|uniref:Nif11 domain-containing protein n=1 Tax=Chelativorans salis TaxID=2978478 RepID=A0ABT2LJT7_9HYPH|nr:hypothetical protein [Chelativorans sp. EGI FJ00035]MCT7373948.1 hypothetical protein [Chelativorans sp. EGI FJ00035]
MPARPLIDKAMILCLLDELAERGLSEKDVDRALVRDGPVDLDLLAECKREHPHFNPSHARGNASAVDAERRNSPLFWSR